MSTINATLDPHASLNSPTRYGLFEGLLNQDENGKLLPGLASEWKSVDPTTWEFKLAQGRKFSDGSPVTVQDVKYTYDRAQDVSQKLGITSRITLIDHTEIADLQTFRIVTKNPDPILLKRVAAVMVMSQKHTQDVGADALGTKPLGSGPFMMKEFRPNDRLVLVPNPNYPKKALPSEVTLFMIPESSARLAGLKTGELDLIGAIPVDQADLLKRDGINIISSRNGSISGAFLFSTLEGKPTGSTLVRQALNYAVDKDAIVKNIYKGYAQASSQLVQPETFGYNPNLKPYPYDPKKAKELLAQAGYPNGFNLTMDVLTTSSEAQAMWLLIQSEFKDIGITADINLYSDYGHLGDAWYGRIQRSEILAVTVLNSPAMDADFALTWFKGSEPLPGRRFNNPDFDQAYQASTTEMDEKKRLALLQKALAVAHDDPPFLYLIDPLTLTGAKPNLENVIARTDGDIQYDTMRKK